MRRISMGMLLGLIMVTAVSAAAAGDSAITVKLGYSFSNASLPTSQVDIVSLDESGNEPLLAISGTTKIVNGFTAEVVLAMGSFGRNAQVDTSDGSSSEFVDAVSTRRSLLADMTLRQHLYGRDSWSIMATYNAGFLFDAQKEEENVEVQNASSYHLAGITMSAVVDKTQGRRFGFDFLLGYSEIMTDIEPFSLPLETETLRIRPRIRFDFGDCTDTEATFLHKVTISLWGDLGIGENYGDTYALTLSKAISL